MKQNYTNNFLKNFFISILIVFLGIQITSAQDPVLFDHTWHMEKVTFDGDEYNIADYTDYTGTTEFTEEDAYEIFVSLCDWEYFNSIPNFSTASPSEFTLPNIHYNPFPMSCQEFSFNPDFPFIREAIFSVFYESNNQNNIKNPFTYTISPNGSDLSMIIENVDGDKLYYSNVTLSITDKQLKNFEVYPNPFENYINVVNRREGTAFSVQILDMQGAEVYRNPHINEISKTNFEYLKQGVYFIILEDNLGKKYTQKLLKQ